MVELYIAYEIFYWNNNFFLKMVTFSIFISNKYIFLGVNDFWALDKSFFFFNRKISIVKNGVKSVLIF